MAPLPAAVSDSELIAFIDRWAALLEREDYEAAFALTGHIPEMGWTPTLIGEVIKGYGEASPGQRVTVNGEASDLTATFALTWADGGVAVLLNDIHVM